MVSGATASSADWQSRCSRPRSRGSLTPIEMLRKGLEKPDQSLANAWRACKTFSVKDRLVELRCPVLVTHGTSDPLIPYRAGELIHEAIPGSRFFAEAGAGHSLPSSRAESFNVNLLAHLRDAESG